ncbi:glycosyltransferase family 39 protein [Spirillospora sp. CA-294931]|uniref:glycosyltransferase family 39 protein n=1 Tax=Spirillospora sp. CA-294931 TaxID=3240042 RepID=UPI003D8A27EB
MTDGEKRTSRLEALVLGVPAVAALTLGFWGASGLSLWRDEGISVLVARRSIPDMARFLSHLDAVHGTYYLLLHGVIALFGDGELALRLASIVALAVAAAGVAALGRGLISPLGGLLAGLVYAGSPFASRHALEVRAYAITTALAVVATLLLVRTLEDGTRRRYAGYGAAVVALGAVHLFALLVVAAHLVTVLLTRRERLAGWLATMAAAGLVLSPLAVLAASQSHVTHWLRRPGLGAVSDFATEFSGSDDLVPVVGLAVLAGVALARPRGPVDVRALALPWLVVPAAVLMLVSQFHPIYQPRYVIASLPAVALLAAAGLVRLRRHTWVAPLLLIGLLAAEPQAKLRDPGRWPDQLREGADVVRRHSRPGDAVVWLPAGRRAVGEVYPDAFGHLRDLAMAVSPTRAEDFAGIEHGPDEIVRRLQDPSVTRAWLVEGETLWRGPGMDPVNRAKIDGLTAHFRPSSHWRVRGLSITLYTRRS